MNIKTFLPVLLLMGISVGQILPPIQVGYATVSGTVSRDNGMLAVFTPIPNAKVYLEEMLNILANQPALGNAIGIPAPVYWVVDSAITDKNGAYAMDSVAINGAAYRLTYSAKGYQTKQIFANAAKDTVINMQLTAQTRFYNLTGRVVRDCPMCGSLLDPPLPACTVTVRFPFLIIPGPVTQAVIGPLPIRLMTFSAVTDANGIYLIDSIPADSGIDVSDSVLVFARKSGYVPDTIKTVLHVNAIDTVNFRLLIGLVNTVMPGKALSAAKSIMNYDAATGILRLVIDKSQIVSIQAYRANGKLVENIVTNGFMTAGMHSFFVNQKKAGDGMVIIRAAGENFCETIRVQ
jgi:hypothetical protein